MTKPKKLLSSLFFATLFATTGCVTSAPKETSEDPDIYKVNEAEWNAAISFNNITHYRFRRAQTAQRTMFRSTLRERSSIASNRNTAIPGMSGKADIPTCMTGSLVRTSITNTK